MSKFEIIDDVLNNYLSKYGAKIPTFEDDTKLDPPSSFKAPDKVSQSPEVEMRQLFTNTRIDAENTRPLKPADLKQHYQQLMSPQQINDLLNSASVLSESNNPSVQSNRQLTKELMAEQLLAKALIARTLKTNKPNVPEDPKVPIREYINMYYIQQHYINIYNITIIFYEQSTSIYFIIRYEQIYSMQVQIKKLKANLEQKDLTIKTLETENAKLKQMIKQKEYAKQKSGVLETELKNALLEVQILKEEKRKMEAVFQKILK
ncbi:Hypothetical_protein [Hexamita inflata]|uniref:Hypothetical_protein n=1 Tax=Hexamita inflata TaxID=28002 RepID=A0AA86PKP0_9EUKA|nr:Hypothetical protein HINF_LOCUS26603 [Hexamita inflata]